jgi:glutathione S-transferase
MLTLYFAPGSSSMAPHIALHEVGVPFEARLLSLAKRETRSPEYLAVNPEGKVPTLVVDGHSLTEVAAILFYLAKRYPEAHLLPPGDLLVEAQAISWMSFVASTVQPARQHGLAAFRAAFDLAERRLGDREWALGPYSIVDIHLFRLFWRLRGAYPLAAGELPRLSAHYDRAMARPAVRRTCEVEAASATSFPSERASGVRAVVDPALDRHHLRGGERRGGHRIGHRISAERGGRHELAVHFIVKQAGHSSSRYDAKQARRRAGGRGPAGHGAHGAHHDELGVRAVCQVGRQVESTVHEPRAAGSVAGDAAIREDGIDVGREAEWGRVEPRVRGVDARVARRPRARFRTPATLRGRGAPRTPVGAGVDRAPGDR